MGWRKAKAMDGGVCRCKGVGMRIGHRVTITHKQAGQANGVNESQASQLAPVIEQTNGRGTSTAKRVAGKQNVS